MEAQAIERTAPRIAAAGTGWLVADLGDVQAVYMDSRVTDASFETYLSAAIAQFDPPGAPRRRGIVYYVPQPAAMSSQRRRKLGELLKSREAEFKANTLAYAMATPSTAVRSGLRVLFWFAPPPYPNAVVATPAEAFEFVARYVPNADPAALARDFERLLEDGAARMAAR